MPVIRNCFECGPTVVDSEDDMVRVDDADGFVVYCPEHAPN